MRRADDGEHDADDRNINVLQIDWSNAKDIAADRHVPARKNTLRFARYQSGGAQHSV
jgi:hypothetical protein